MDESIKDRMRFLRFRISTRLDSLFFPIDGRDLLEVTKKIGYQVLPTPEPTMAAKANVRLDFSGNFAQKNGVILDANTSRGILGVSADSYIAVTTALDELRAVILSEFGVDLEAESRFYEILAEIFIESANNPLEAISKLFEKNRFISRVGKILNQDVSMATLKFVTKGKVPNQEEWLEITIEPYMVMPTRRYAISVIFRSKDKSVVERFGENLESNLYKITEEIEGS